MKSKSISLEKIYVLFLFGVTVLLLLFSSIDMAKDLQQCQKIMETLQKEPKK